MAFGARGTVVPLSVHGAVGSSVPNSGRFNKCTINPNSQAVQGAGGVLMVLILSVRIRMMIYEQVDVRYVLRSNYVRTEQRERNP